MLFGHQINVLNSTLASTLRAWRGTKIRQLAEQPPQLPELFDREGSVTCRLVREIMTELDLDCMIYPCPKNGHRHSARLKALSGADTVPFLFDPNTGAKLTGVQDIVNYLLVEFTEEPEINRDFDSMISWLSSLAATQVRLLKGIYARPSHEAAKPLVLYSFESSPYSRLVREKLCELEIPYQLINLTKQQWADMGPAKFRFHLGEYRPLAGSKREAFLQQHGEVQVPFLIDPNTESELFESQQILHYLEAHYAAKQSQVA